MVAHQFYFEFFMHAPRPSIHPSIYHLPIPNPLHSSPIHSYQHASSETHETSQPHLFELLLMLYHRAVEHTLRKLLSAFFHIHELTGACNWHVSLLLTGQRVILFLPTQKALLILLMAVAFCLFICFVCFTLRTLLCSGALLSAFFPVS